MADVQFPECDTIDTKKLLQDKLIMKGLKLLTYLFIVAAMTGNCASKPDLVLDTKQTKAFKFEIGDGNIYIIKGKRNIMIDTGDPGKEQKIIEALKTINLEPKDISLIILTHGHGDHSGNTKFFKDKYLIPVAGGQGDLPMFKSGKMGERKPTGFMGTLILPISNYVYEPFDPDKIITEEISLSEFGVDGKVFQMPGHTAGSLITIVENKYAFVGDLMRGSILSGKTPTEHFFHFSRELVKENMKKLLDQGIEVFYVGHWGPISAADVKKEFFE